MCARVWIHVSVYAHVCVPGCGFVHAGKSQHTSTDVHVSVHICSWAWVSTHASYVRVCVHVWSHAQTLVCEHACLSGSVCTYICVLGDVHTPRCPCAPAHVRVNTSRPWASGCVVCTELGSWGQDWASPARPPPHHLPPPPRCLPSSSHGSPESDSSGLTELSRSFSFS